MRCVFLTGLLGLITPIINSLLACVCFGIDANQVTGDSSIKYCCLHARSFMRGGGGSKKNNVTPHQTPADEEEPGRRCEACCSDVNVTDVNVTDVYARCLWPWAVWSRWRAERLQLLGADVSPELQADGSAHSAWSGNNHFLWYGNIVSWTSRSVFVNYPWTPVC